jgi:hypothetical protein
MFRRISTRLAIGFVTIFCLVDCSTTLHASKFSKQDKSGYPSASVDADRVLTLISNKDRTRFLVDGNAIGSPIGAGGELKILVNGLSHDIAAEAPGYKAKLQHTQPPYDERSPISFSFIYKDKLTNDESPVTLVNSSSSVVIHETQTAEDHANKPQVAASLAVKPTSFSALGLNNNKNQRRVALVIGNSAYQYTAPLANPTNDAEDVASALQKVNFQVILKTNADLETMADAVYQLGESLKGGGIGLFYYSGHGLQVKGENYLLPVDANLTREDEVKRKAISANDVVEKMGEGKSHLNLVFLDACRNNPFPSSSRAVSRGLIGMNAPNGTLLIFSTNPDNVAQDGNGRNGTYTKHLLQEIDQPGLEVGMMLRKVRTAVKEETGGKQVPWENGSIEGEFYFNEDLL